MTNAKTFAVTADNLRNIFGLIAYLAERAWTGLVGPREDVDRCRPYNCPHCGKTTFPERKER